MLDLLVPVDVVDSVENVGGDPGDGMEALDAFRWCRDSAEQGE